MARFTRVFGVPTLRVDFVRGMRFRLMLSYVLFFTVLLALIGLIFRQTLKFQTEGDVRDALEEEWDAAKGYLKIENQRPIWIADQNDPEEDFIVSRLRHVYLITDSSGERAAERSKLTPPSASIRATRSSASSPFTILSCTSVPIKAARLI